MKTYLTNIQRMRHAALLLLAFLTLPIQAADDDLGTPIATFHTLAYESQGAENVINILFGATETGHSIIVDDGNTRQTLELQVATIDSESGNWSGSVATCTVSKEGWVKVYGNAEVINLINASGCKIDRADLSQLTTLNILDMSLNELKALNLEGLMRMQALYLNDNPFSETPLLVGSDKEGMLILDIGQVGQLDPSFTLKDYPALRSFDAWYCQQLYKVEPEGCPNLQRLSIDTTPVQELDVTKNPLLQTLNISETAIQDIDLSQNANLRELYCDHSGSGTDRKLKTIDLSHNPYLIRLFASGNLFESIDLSKNIYLTDIFLNYNQLSAIDLSQHQYIINLMLRNNNLDFATLPLPQDVWTQYDYMQRPMPVAKSYAVGATIDLSKRVLREGYTTTMALYRTSDSDPSALTALDESYYRYENGVVTLLKETAGDSIYVAFACDAFPALTLDGMPLKTEKFVVKTAEDFNKAALALSFIPANATGAVAFGVGMQGASEETPKTLGVDFGDGVMHDFRITSEKLTNETVNVNAANSNGPISLYIAGDDQLTALSINGTALTDINLSAAKQLKQLYLNDTRMKSIDLGWNRALEVLELTGNDFDSLNIRGANDAFQKNLLQDINLSNNQLNKVTLNDNYTIHHLNLSHNQLTELSFKDGDMMESINVADNQLERIELSYCTILKKLDISNNRIVSIVMPEEHQLQSLHCENNALSFTSLPQLEGVADYVYAPQSQVTIATQGPGADLSAHNLNKQTVYTWKTTDGEMLTAGTDYTVTDGRTRFQPSTFGKQLYCEMTHEAFNQLTLTTSAIESMDLPAYELGRFTMTADSAAILVLRTAGDPINIGIDWQGDGTDYEQFTVTNEACRFDVKGRTGATARVCAYSETPGLTVFSLNKLPLSQADFSKMTELVMLSVNNAGLSNITLPQSKELSEMSLDGNRFSQLDLTQYEKLYYLMLNNNEFKTFDASLYPNLGLLGLGGNRLTDVKFDNPQLWSLSLSGNELTEVDFSKAKSLYQLSLDYNKLSRLDVSKLKELAVLFVDHNRFTFSTLPVNKGYALYTYANQDYVEIEAHNGIVDLSSEANIYGIDTEYRWFVDAPFINENGELDGEELFVDVEYSVNGGITTFLRPEENVMCVMTNSNFPDLYLCTTFIDVDETSLGIEQTTATTLNEGGTLYTIDGKQVKHLQKGESLEGVKPGLYLIKRGDKTEKRVIR